MVNISHKNLYTGETVHTKIPTLVNISHKNPYIGEYFTEKSYIGEHFTHKFLHW